jgi:hypothetical protein
MVLLVLQALTEEKASLAIMDPLVPLVQTVPQEARVKMVPLDQLGNGVLQE